MSARTSTHLILVLAMLALPTAARAQSTDEPAQPAPVPTPTPPDQTTPVEPPTTDPPTTDPPTTDPAPSDDETPDKPENHKGKKLKKGSITYKPGRWLRIHFEKHHSLSIRILVQPEMRFGQVFGSTLPAGFKADAQDATVDILIRRARLGFKAALADGVGLKWEIQIKNMHFGLSNLYGTYSPNKNHEFQFGFLKPPGGLERDAYSFDEPFIERSIVAYLTLDHEMGFKATGWEGDHTINWVASITRNAPPAVDGGDPEDAPKAPPGGELEDLTRPAGNWNAAAELNYVPCVRFVVGARAGIRSREEVDVGDRIAEPYDTAIAEPRAWKGLMFSAQAYAGTAGTHYRLMTEGGMRRDGHALAFAVPPTILTTDLTSHQRTYVGYVIAGWSWNGHYGSAADAAPLLDGSEITLRIEGAYVHLPPGATDFNGVVRQAEPLDWGSATIAYHWEVNRNLRMQWDLAVERGARAEIFGGVREHFTRVFAQYWATFRL